ncbi:Vacuolar proton pump subunit F [Nosema bombycis CQ1]|uniref:Vacuolar proton pump subunit F n=1 Tax=Nosema bombycis (strain CQ1 / CVCC 102059) TaxID=578461 RepID=R0KR16_NOSB1|nr:Vacuolar proton pump subunit F [Nosema bombycis CQ1]|eukprot:EOB12657.1 Vacuolar proton pump subunit F [Nosema bombycis CQ1]
MPNKTQIGIIGDEDTLNGFMIAGIPHGPNLVQVSPSTHEDDLKTIFSTLVRMKGLSILLVSDFVSKKIKEEIEKHNSKELPFVFVIPSRNEGQKDEE